MTAMYAQLASSPRAALRNLAYLQNDLADPVLRRHVLRMSRSARAHYEKLVTAAVAAGELRADTNATVAGARHRDHPGGIVSRLDTVS